MVQQYNKPMGGVELFDSTVAVYRVLYRKKVMVPLLVMVAISFCCDCMVVETETYEGVNSMAYRVFQSRTQ